MYCALPAWCGHWTRLGSLVVALYNTAGVEPSIHRAETEAQPGRQQCRPSQPLPVRRVVAVTVVEVDSRLQVAPSDDVQVNSERRDAKSDHVLHLRHHGRVDLGQDARAAVTVVDHHVVHAPAAVRFIEDQKVVDGAVARCREVVDRAVARCRHGEFVSSQHVECRYQLRLLVALSRGHLEANTKIMQMQ